MSIIANVITKKKKNIKLNVLSYTFNYHLNKSSGFFFYLDLNLNFRIIFARLLKNRPQHRGGRRHTHTDIPEFHAST